MWTDLFSLCVIVIAVSLVLRLEKRLDSSQQHLNALLENLSRARAKREQWQRDRPWLKNPFDSDEYHEKWRIEIGAEELAYVLYPKKNLAHALSGIHCRAG